MMEIEKRVEEAFFSSTVKYLESLRRKFETKIHVTALVYECLRRGYYAMTLGEIYDMGSAIRMAVGRKIHEISLGGEHELELEHGEYIITTNKSVFKVDAMSNVYRRADGVESYVLPKCLEVGDEIQYNGEWQKIEKIEPSVIVGTIDEYIDGIIVEKKTTRDIPSRPHSHHVTQVNYYAVLLEKSRRPVIGAVILYIDVGGGAAKAFFVPFEKPLEEVEKEMVRKKKILEEALKNRIPPERYVDWTCQGYCPYVRQCFSPEVVGSDMGGFKGVVEA